MTWIKKYLPWILIVIIPTLIYWAYQVEETGFQVKNLWDWMELIVVPGTLALFGLWFNKITKETEQVKNQSVFETELLRSYLDKITELFLMEKLKIDGPNEVKMIAKARTISVLRSFSDKTRRNVILSFLRDSGLNAFILKEANLQNANLEGAYLSEAHLEGAYLSGANLKGVGIYRGSFRESELGWRRFKGSELWRG